MKVSFSALLLSSALAFPIVAADTNVDAKSASGKLSGIELEYRSKTLSPGDNFYEFVNEGWLKNTDIPADQSNYGSFSKLDDGAKEAIRVLIEEAGARSAPEGSDAQKVGDFFKSYTNVELRNKLGTKPIEPLLADVRAANDGESMAKLVAKLLRLGIAGPMAMYISPDAKKSDQYTVYATQAGTTLPDRDYYLKDDAQYAQARAALQEYISDMLVRFGHDNAADAAKRIMELETKLAALQWTRVENRDPEATYNKVSRTQFSSMLSEFDLDVYIDACGLPEQEEFIVRQPTYLEKLNELIPEISLQTWQDYYTFRVIDAFAVDLSEELEKRHFDFHQTTLSGIEEQMPMWRRGVEASNGILGEIVGRLYVERHFPPEAKVRMVELVDNLKKAYAKRIDGLEWMSPVTQKAAHEKLAKFNTKIGYPDQWKDYSKLVIKPDDLVGNYMRAAAVEHAREIGKLGGPIDRNEWFMNPQMVNAYYSASMNEIVFPAAILQPPFFNMEADDAVNYGGIGAVIGHEISHGFDDKGSQYDGDGNLRKWWSEEDRTEFERRAAKLTEQYNSYKPFEDMSVNGELTLGENIGDLGGMAVAYEAYRMSLDGKEAPVIDGLTGDQRFFYGWAQVWRRLYREPELRKRLLTDSHSPSEYRCNGIVSNMDAFYEAFSIKPDSPMYIAPEKRVRIW
ncbi:MAG: M13-type metalloendopeptidase [Pirellulaceae bacterium]